MANSWLAQGKYWTHFKYLCMVLMHGTDARKIYSDAWLAEFAHYTHTWPKHGMHNSWSLEKTCTVTWLEYASTVGYLHYWLCSVSHQCILIYSSTCFFFSVHMSGANKHQSAVTCLQFNRKFVITCSDDGTVKLWDLNTGEFIRNLVTLDSGGSGGVVWRVCANQTKLVCAVGSRNGTEETKLLVLDFEPDPRLWPGSGLIGKSVAGVVETRGPKTETTDKNECSFVTIGLGLQSEANGTFISRPVALM